MALNYTLTQLSEILENILGPEAGELIARINLKPGNSNSPFISLPTSFSSTDDIARLIAKTSNEYGQACRLAGLARAKYKISEAAYKYKFRTSLGFGKNSAEREAKALEAAKVEYEEMIILESVVELCESIESATRIASESSRRLLLSVDQASKADARFDYNAHALPETDFSPV